ncbi:hypothetical protein RMSM_03942 [Rhodopirellula maiorica SM1]|uniref:Uncharacterized protein n=1 Tax=Rhodopirellula maiorica SM1 TaxID=1265738 RepID=M5RYX4_9BACT|nr:hypothetical protein RMSM_03942 [Rhodopirellula maiorica SM1]
MLEEGPTQGLLGISSRMKFTCGKKINSANNADAFDGCHKPTRNQSPMSTLKRMLQRKILQVPLGR